MRAASVQSAQTGPCAVHDRSCVPSVVGSVLMSFWVCEEVKVGDEEDISVSAALTILESRVCICEREIWDAPSARPPGALNT